MRRFRMLFGAAFLAAGCASTPPAPIVLGAKPVCPPFHAWTDADLKALAAALAPVPSDSIIIRMALDWRRYYGDAKTCDAAREH